MCRDTDSSVGDLDLDARTVIPGVGPGGNAQVAARWHGVERIGQDFHQRLLHLHRVDPDIRECGRDRYIERDATFLQQLGERWREIFDQPGDALSHLMDGSRAREVEQVADTPIEAVHLADDDAEVRAGRREVRLAEGELGGGA